MNILKYVLCSPNCPPKNDPLTALAIGSSVVNGISSLFSSNSANETNIRLARENREWQSKENQLNRDWQESMWNKQNEYNTPANQRRLAEEAGYNPYLLSSQQLGSGAGSAGAPSMVGAPNPAHVSPVNPVGSMVDTASQLLPVIQQGQQVESNVELQHSKAVQALVGTAIGAYDKLGYKGYLEVMDKIEPILSQINLSGSRSDVVFENQIKNWLSQRYNTDMDSLNKELSYSLGTRYSEKQIQAGLEKIQYDISEIVGRLNTMNVQNQALLDRTAAEVVEKTAAAFNLRKSGEKYEADAKTVNALRGYLEKSVKAQAEIKSVDAYFANARKDSSSDLVGFQTSREGREALREAYRIPLIRKSNALWTAIDKTFSEYVKVSSGGSAGTAGTYEVGNTAESGSTVYGW